jgi:mono/diheme cytochrome c family protein
MNVRGRRKRTGWPAQGLLVAVLLVVGLSACGDSGSGEDLYAMACSRCHGPDRTGVEDVAPDLTNTGFALEETDDWIAGRVRDGFKEMPRFHRTLSEEQIGVIVAFLRDADSDTVLASASTSTTGPPTTEPDPPTVTSIATTSPPDTPSSTQPPAATTTMPPEGPPPTTAAPDSGDDVLALGQFIFDVDAGGVGCARCHGFDATGTSDGPNIIGVSKSAISGALGGGVPDMDNIVLSRDELDAVYQYVVMLTLER